MPNNDLSQITPRLLAMGLLALRNNSIAARLVNTDLGTQAARKGASIDVGIASAVAAKDVVPGPNNPTTDPIAPKNAPVQLNQWKQADFTMTDQDLGLVEQNILPMQASEAISSLIDVVDSHILGNYVDLYSFYGTPGQTPFETNTKDANQVGALLLQEKTPVRNRRFVLDPWAEANAKDLRAFQDASFGGGAGVILEGRLNQKLGFDWFADQNIPTHISGTLSGTTGALQALVDGVTAVGATTVNLNDTALTGTVVKGDVFTVAGDTQTYVATDTFTAAGNAIANLSFRPAVRTEWADNAVFTVKASHVVNQAWHRDCYAFASRPLLDLVPTTADIMSATDPISGVSLRLEVSRQHKQTNWCYDILFGSACIRPELGARLAG